MIASWGPWGRPSSIVMVVSWEFHQQPMTNSSLVSIAPSYSFDDTTKKAGMMQRCPGWGKPHQAIFCCTQTGGSNSGFLDVTGYFPNLPDDFFGSFAQDVADSFVYVGIYRIPWWRTIWQGIVKWCGMSTHLGWIITLIAWNEPTWMMVKWDSHCPLTISMFFLCTFRPLYMAVVLPQCFAATNYTMELLNPRWCILYIIYEMGMFGNHGVYK